MEYQLNNYHLSFFAWSANLAICSRHTLRREETERKIYYYSFGKQLELVAILSKHHLPVALAVLVFPLVHEFLGHPKLNKASEAKQSDYQ